MWTYVYSHLPTLPLLMNSHQLTTPNPIPQSLAGRLQWDSMLVDPKAVGQLPSIVLASSLHNDVHVYSDVCVCPQWKLGRRDLMISVWEVRYHPPNRSLFQYHFQVHPRNRGSDDVADRE